MSGVTPDFRPVDIHVCKRLDFSLVSVYLGGIGGGCLQQMSLFSQFNTVSRLSPPEGGVVRRTTIFRNLFVFLVLVARRRGITVRRRLPLENDLVVLET